MDEKYKHIGDPLDCLAEECAELIHVIMKIKRFGLFSVNPVTNEANILRLLNEMDDVEARIQEVLNDVIQAVKEENENERENKSSD